jgi:hypothetical protein
MNASLVALAVISGIVAAGSFVGFYAGSRRKMDLEQWIVGGRGFGMLLVWLLMAGEVYTTFTFLGASGWAYSKGGPVLYILGYQPLMYVVAFYILPQVWEVGRKYRLQTQADFFQVRYNSKYLAAFVALVGVIFIIIYLQIQITGLDRSHPGHGDLLRNCGRFCTHKRNPGSGVGQRIKRFSAALCRRFHWRGSTIHLFWGHWPDVCRARARQA